MKKLIMPVIPLFVVLYIGAGCKAARWEYNGKKAGQPLQNIDAPAPQFEIEGPTTGEPNKDYQFIGKNCGQDGKITWMVLGHDELGTKEGETVTYRFPRTGTYQIQATCQIPGLPPKSATHSITISIPNGGNGNGGQNQSQNQSQNQNRN